MVEVSYNTVTEKGCSSFGGCQFAVSAGCSAPLLLSNICTC